jgi:hypothetical protein
MRLKTFYLPEEIITNLYTPGEEFQTEDGIEYKGLYHKYITGEIYTQPVWNPKTSKKLLTYTQKQKRDVVYEQLKKDLKTKFNVVNTVKPSPTPTDYANGSITRYFLQQVNTFKITEVDSSQYNDWKSGKIDPNLYSGVDVVWYISGPVNDVSNGPAVAKGVRSKNIQQTQFANKTIPGITNVLTNPTQYYSDTDFIVPKDINE